MKLRSYNGQALFQSQAAACLSFVCNTKDVSRNHNNT